MVKCQLRLLEATAQFSISHQCQDISKIETATSCIALGVSQSMWSFAVLMVVLSWSPAVHKNQTGTPAENRLRKVQSVSMY